jgi:hypothetical protein
MPKVPLDRPRASIRPIPRAYQRQTTGEGLGLQAAGQALEGASEFVSREYVRKKRGEETAIGLGAATELESAYTGLYLGTADTQGYADLDWHGAREGIKDYETALAEKKAAVLANVPEHLRGKVGIDLDRVEMRYQRKGQIQYGKLQEQNKNASRQATTDQAMLVFATNPADDVEIEAAKGMIINSFEGMDEKISGKGRIAWLGHGYSLAIRALLKNGSPAAVAKAKEYLDDETISGYLVAGGYDERASKGVNAAVANHEASAIVGKTFAKGGMFDDTGRPNEEEILADIEAQDLSPDLKEAAKRKARTQATIANERVNTEARGITNSILMSMASHHAATGRTEMTPDVDASLAVLSIVDPAQSLKIRESIDRQERIFANSKRSHRDRKARAQLAADKNGLLAQANEIRRAIGRNPDEWANLPEAEIQRRISHLPMGEQNKITTLLVSTYRRAPGEFQNTTKTYGMIGKLLFSLDKTKHRTPTTTKEKALADQSTSYLEEQSKVFYEKEGRWPGEADLKTMLDRGFDEGEVIRIDPEDPFADPTDPDRTRMQAMTEFPREEFLTDAESSDFDASKSELNAALKAKGKALTKQNRLLLYLDTLRREGKR